MGFSPGWTPLSQQQNQQKQIADIVKQIQMGLPASRQNPAIVGSTVPMQSGAPSMWSGDYNKLTQQMAQGIGNQPYSMPMGMVNPWLMGRYG
jgi:hypothetical protein